MNQRSLATLIAINAVLLAALVVTVFSPPAQGQFVRGNEYLMLSGQSPQRANQAVIYIIEARSSRMITALYNSANRQLEVMAPRVVADDLRAAPSGTR